MIARYTRPQMGRIWSEENKYAQWLEVETTASETLATRWAFRDLFAAEAVSVAMLDVGWCGGLGEAKKIASMAEAHYVQVAPHVYGGPLIAAAALHLSLCSPNFLIMEAVERFDGVHAQFTEERFDWQDGYLLPPRGPGLGFTLREDVARRHAPQGPQPGTIRSY